MSDDANPHVGGQSELVVEPLEQRMPDVELERLDPADQRRRLPGGPEGASKMGEGEAYRFSIGSTRSSGSASIAP